MADALYEEYKSDTFKYLFKERFIPEYVYTYNITDLFLIAILSMDKVDYSKKPEEVNLKTLKPTDIVICKAEIKFNNEKSNMYIEKDGKIFSVSEKTGHFTASDLCYARDNNAEINIIYSLKLASKSSYDKIDVVKTFLNQKTLKGKNQYNDFMSRYLYETMVDMFLSDKENTLTHKIYTTQIQSIMRNTMFSLIQEINKNKKDKTENKIYEMIEERENEFNEVFYINRDNFITNINEERLNSIVNENENCILKNLVSNHSRLNKIKKAINYNEEKLFVKTYESSSFYIDKEMNIIGTEKNSMFIVNGVDIPDTYKEEKTRKIMIKGLLRTYEYKNPFLNIETLKKYAIYEGKFYFKEESDIVHQTLKEKDDLEFIIPIEGTKGPVIKMKEREFKPYNSYSRIKGGVKSKKRFFELISYADRFKSKEENKKEKVQESKPRKEEKRIQSKSLPKGYNEKLLLTDNILNTDLTYNDIVFAIECLQSKVSIDEDIRITKAKNILILLRQGILKDNFKRAGTEIIKAVNRYYGIDLSYQKYWVNAKNSKPMQSYESLKRDIKIMGFQIKE